MLQRAQQAQPEPVLQRVGRVLQEVVLQQVQQVLQEVVLRQVQTVWQVHQGMDIILQPMWPITTDRRHTRPTGCIHTLLGRKMDQAHITQVILTPVMDMGITLIASPMVLITPLIPICKTARAMRLVI